MIVPIDAQGGLIETQVRHHPSGGLSPRDMQVSPDGRMVAVSNQRSNEVVVFEFDVEQGSLTELQRLKTPSAPLAVEFIQGEVK